MAPQRIALFGDHTRPAIVACAAAVRATNNSPQFRNTYLFSADPSQQEPFDAVVVVGDSEREQLVFDTHQDAGIPVFQINDVETEEEFLADPGAAGFLDHIGAALEEQKNDIGETAKLLEDAANRSADIAALPRIADLTTTVAALDVDAVVALKARDTRRTAAPIYDARLAELASVSPATPPATPPVATPPADSPAT